MDDSPDEPRPGAIRLLGRLARAEMSDDEEPQNSRHQQRKACT